MPKKYYFSNAEHQLHDEAARETGFDDFGTDDYLTGLRILLSALDENTSLTESGRDFSWRLIRASLISRLYATEGWRTHPKSITSRIERPVIITGIPRTGTTALHRLLSLDSRFQGLERWLTHFPMPRPPRESWEESPQFQSAVEHIAQFQGAQPKMQAAHNIIAEEVDECVEVLRHSFVSNIWGSIFRVPTYDAWWKQQDEKASYQFYADVLRLIGFQQSAKTWLLKNPGHIWKLENLLEAFPDAIVIMTHRDPVKAIPSLCSLMEMAHSVTEGDQADPRYGGQREVALWSEAVTRAMRIRSDHENQFLDVSHRDFHDKPMEVVEKIYDKLGFSLSAETEELMVTRSREKPELALGTHKYDISRFGLTPDNIRSAFSDYIQQFGLR